MRIPFWRRSAVVVAWSCVPLPPQKCFRIRSTVSLNRQASCAHLSGPPITNQFGAATEKKAALILLWLKLFCTIGTIPRGIDVPERRFVKSNSLLPGTADGKSFRSGRQMLPSRALFFHAHTVHHRTKVLIDVANIRGRPIKQFVGRSAGSGFATD